MNDSLSNSGNKIKKPLIPPFHTLQNSHLEITIDQYGNFIDAERIIPEEIIIPCTEKSANAKTGTNPPSHPLCEMIKYCAGDYSGSKKTYFRNYQTQISSWHYSKYTHPFVSAIYQYIMKKRLVEDLKITGKELFSPDEELGDLMVRWKVEIPGENESRCWKSHSLFESWQKYCESQDSIRGICMVTGKNLPLAINHPKRIRHSGDSGKLISSNDKKGFTFRGRFLTDNLRTGEKKSEISIQCVSISSEVSQKAHSALSWLIDRQGFKNDDQVVLCWALSGKIPPDPFADSLKILEDRAEDTAQQASVTYTDAGQTFAKKLTKKIAGFRVDIGNTEKIIVLALDSVVPGRISITYYRELTCSEFLERIEQWHKQMAWHFRSFYSHSKIGSIVYAPSPTTIAEVCYGPKRDEDFKRYKRKMNERLLPCIIDNRPLPIDIVNTAVNKASNRISFEKTYQGEQPEWEQALSVACSLYSYHSNRQNNKLNKSEKTMALEKERTDRDYLYGRLLAVAEHIEEIALSLSNENRETNAARMMHIFSEKPFLTWEKLYDRLAQGYFPRLQTRRPGFLYNMKNLIGEIKCLFKNGDFEKKERLSGLYLLGYHCQRLELKNHSKQEEENQELEINQN
jgi:CRISPR-associated protein Csd1